MHGLVLQSPGSIFLQLGPFTIRWYGIMFALGFVCVLVTGTRLGKKFGFKDEDVINCALLNFVAGVIGARLYFVALKWDYFCHHLDQIGATWLGGLSIHGGVIGAMIATAIFCRRAGISFFSMCDVLAAAMPLAQAVGRWGNFFNSELFGQPVPDDFPIKVFIPPQLRPDTAKSFSYFHATFLYESVWDLLLFLFLYFYVVRKFKDKPFFTSLVYIAGYNLGRLLIEPLRMDSIMVNIAGNAVQSPMIASALCLFFAVVGMVILLMRKKPAQDKALS
ncbi:MAG TPA: prolipoprotein diacylglyceryl transferase [Drouetiella sp.]